MTSTTVIKPDIKGMTVADLKAFCIRKNIPVKGLKLRSQLEKAIESHALAPIKISHAEADQLLQKSENSQPDSEIQNKGWWDSWRDCLQYDDAGNCITKAQILTSQSEKYVGEICSVVVATSAVGAVLEAADGYKTFCCYPDEFKLVAGFSECEYWECESDRGTWVEFTHIDSEPAPHRKRLISRSEYDRRTQPAQPRPQRHNVMPNSDTNGAGGGDKKTPIVATGGAGAGDERDPLKLNPDRVPPYFGDRTHKADDTGQLNLLELDEEDAPDPDDFTSHENYLAAWDKWKAGHPEFQEGGEYPAIGSRQFAAEINLIDNLIAACHEEPVKKLPALPPLTDIKELIEVSDLHDRGETLGYYCEGHYDALSFVEVVNAEYSDEPDDDFLSSKVVHQYWEVVKPDSNDDDGTYQVFQNCQADKPGAFPVTVVYLEW